MEPKTTATVELIYPNVIKVTHHGLGTGENGLFLVAALEKLAMEAIEQAPVLVYHDIADLQKPTEAYGRVIGNLGEKLGDKDFKYVTFIPIAVVRIIAYFAIKIGKVDAQICKSKDVARKKIGDKGYPVDII